MMTVKSVRRVKRVGRVDRFKVKTLLTLPTLLTLFVLHPPRLHAAPELILSTSTLAPGDTLRVELDNISPSDKLKAVFRGRSYAFFPRRS